jgi:uncharacterized damage-inducible protein DinB
MTGGATQGHNAPGIVAGERQTLQAFLDYLRQSVDRKIDGLSEDQARRVLVASSTSLLGIVKHLAFVETYWAQHRLAGIDIVVTGDGFTLDETDTVASARRAYEDACRRTDDIVTACDDLERPLARGRHGLTLRWMLTHLLGETGRHAGHADILRELIDGSRGR